MLSLFSSAVLLVESACLLMLPRSVRSDSPVCKSIIQKIHGGEHVIAQIPPNITGHWVSDSCEVRPGPEFITRSYRFFSNHSFQALQFYYQDAQCSRPSYSLLILGHIYPEHPSHTVRGGTDAEYRLHHVLLMCYELEAVPTIQQRMLSSCDLRQPLQIGETYQLLDETGHDCTGGLHFSMQELTLIRLEQHEGMEELFLGDVHTEREHKRRHKPAAYQSPLQRAEVSLHHCAVCRVISVSSFAHPPLLQAHPDPPLFLDGHWVSLRCEARPGRLFLTRQLHFHSKNRTWSGLFQHFSDPECSRASFSISAKGNYTPGDTSRSIRGAVEFTFMVSQMSLRPLDAATISLLSVFFRRSSAHSCGGGSWSLGVAQDLSTTSGCPALGLRLPHTEYEIFRSGRDQFGRYLLFNGQRPSDGSSPETPERRPTAFQPPLLECSSAGGEEQHRQGHWRDEGKEEKRRLVGRGRNNTLNGVIILLTTMIPLMRQINEN
ncbi:hypothetical protein DNTS_025483 [Danionella cerebrum]|uniref:APCDD1 domain-containing protein n=1 Tax=Danionella cerebrum TaxID=2873325 RepID=A0A553R1N2_9TELE|nr:hypothetical protein DNTS_025483 [Danionella translucida]